MKAISGIMLILLFIGVLTLAFNIQPVKTEQATIIVPDEYPTIQDAMNVASDGDTIIVRSGTYYENVFVNKSISLIGENPKSTIIDGSNATSSINSFNPAIYIYGNNIKVCNFTIKGSSNAWGVYILGCENVWIKNNLITENSGGIVSDFSNNVTLIGNNITNNEYEGLFLFGASKNILKNNTIRGNMYNFGVMEKFDHDIGTSNRVDGKTVYYLKNQKDLTVNQSSFPDLGYLALINCTDVIVENLSITNNYNGLLLVETENSTVKNSGFQNNIRGIDIINSSNNTLKGNNVTNSWVGISLANSPNNTFRENNLSNNGLSFTVDGDSLNDFVQNIDLSNTINGKFMRYLINCTDLIVNPSIYNNTEYFAFINCHNVTVEDLSLRNNELLFAFSHNSSITGNNISNGTIKLVHSSLIKLIRNIILNGSGISINHSNYTSIVENKIIQSCYYGINLQKSSFNLILYNEIKSNEIGMNVRYSTNNTIIGNNITENEYCGVLLTESWYNKIFHNNFINNTRQAFCSPVSPTSTRLNKDYKAIVKNLTFIPPPPIIIPPSSPKCNLWDNGYPSSGNYWSDYNGTDFYSGPYQNETGSDGIGDTTYTGTYLADRYPLMGPFRSFNTSVGCAVDVVSNSTIEDFQYFESNDTIIMHVSNMTANQTYGFCRLSIPHELLSPPYNITINNIPVQYSTIFENQTLSIIYFTYEHSTIEIIIIPEFPLATILTAFMILTTIITVLIQRKRKR